MSRTAVVGMGNILYRDEGVGVYAAHYLRAAYRFHPEIDIYDGAMLGFALTDLFHDGGRLVILDAMLANDQPGTVYCLPAAELLNLGSDVRPTAHEVEPIQLLKQAAALDVDIDLTLIGIVPSDFSTMQLGLTPGVHAGFPAFIAAIVAELSALGIEAEPVGVVSVDDVIDSLVVGAR